MSQEHSSVWVRFFRRIFGNTKLLEKAIEDAKEEGEIKDHESTMLMGILELRSLTIAEIMTPRSQIEAIPSTASLSEVATFIKTTSYSRIPVYEETKDYITGIVYARDLVEPLLDTSNHSLPISKFARDAFFTSETKTLHVLLEEFKLRKCHIAIVLDEYSGTAGLVTVSDILKTIFGKLDDEYDESTPEEEIQIVNDTTFILPGKTPLEELETIGIKLESEEVETIGGYLTYILGSIPQKGEQFTIDTLLFTILQSDKKQIRTMQIEVLNHTI